MMMVLVAGAYRSGTNADPTSIEANLRAMNQAALEPFHAGYLGITGEAVALPTQINDAGWNEFTHPIGGMLAECCDAVLRIGSPSSGADEMVSIAQAHAKRVFYSVAEVTAK